MASGVGIDALSIGGWGGPEKGEPSHVVLLGADKVILEELNIPDELAGRRVFSPRSLSCCTAVAARGHEPSPGSCRDRAVQVW
jgi:kynurenine formamidase